MAEDNNIFSEFGVHNSKFEELRKKYQTIDENGDVVPARAAELDSEPAAMPESDPDYSYIPDSNEVVDDSEQYNAIDEPMAYNAAAVVEPQAHTDVAEPTAQATASEAETSASQPESADAAPAVSGGFVFDAQARYTDDDVNSTPTEPDYSYDINTFGKSKYGGTLDIESFDDSWLESAFDDSIFYKAEPVEPAPQVQEPESEPVQQNSKFINEASVRETSPAYEVPAEAQPQAAAEQSDSTMTGGYVAQTSFTDFAFDPDSGMDFGEDDVCHADSKRPSGNSFVEKLKKKPSKEKKESGKNEMTAITGFSKSYKASEGKGSKKESFSLRNFIPQRDDSTFERFVKITVIVCVLVFIGASLYLLNYYLIEPEENANAIQQLEQLVGEEQGTLDEQTLAARYPGVEFPEGMLAKYASLYAENQDLVGWVKIDALGISQPVVRGENNRKYLTSDFSGKSGKYGTVFMNSANKVERLNFNTALFGHNMNDSKMFGNLTEYMSVDGYKKAPVVEFNTIYGDFKWKIFAVFISNGTAEGDDGYLFNYTFTDLSSYDKIESFYDEVKQRSLYYPNVDVLTTDKILTLSTCTYEFDEARLVVMARMLRPGESEEVDTNVAPNPNPRYPAAYYKKNGLSDPYASAYDWTPG
ncbi:MAG: sortase [Clostridia bacterium]|nr:sortase [Clostridia bacterium]